MGLYEDARREEEIEQRASRAAAARERDDERRRLQLESPLTRSNDAVEFASALQRTRLRAVGFRGGEGLLSASRGSGWLIAYSYYDRDLDQPRWRSGTSWAISTEGRIWHDTTPRYSPRSGRLRFVIVDRPHSKAMEGPGFDPSSAVMLVKLAIKAARIDRAGRIEVRSE